MRRIYFIALVIAILVFSSCAQPPAEAPAPTPEPTPTPTPAPSPPAPTPTPTPTPKPAPAVTEEVAELLRIQFVPSGYSIQQVLPSAFGLCAQLALLPNGDIAISDYNHRIHLLSNGTVRTLVDQKGLKPAIAALAHGCICYGMGNGQLFILDPDTDTIELLGTTPLGDSTNALVADEASNVYAATFKRNLYRFDADGNRTTIAANLPFEGDNHITDMDITSDRIIYIAGHKLFIGVSPDGAVTTITDNLHNEPTWCEIDFDDHVYIKDIPSGVRRYDPKTGTLTPIQVSATFSLFPPMNSSSSLWVLTSSIATT